MNMVLISRKSSTTSLSVLATTIIRRTARVRWGRSSPPSKGKTWAPPRETLWMPPSSCPMSWGIKHWTLGLGSKNSWAPLEGRRVTRWTLRTRPSIATWECWNNKKRRQKWIQRSRKADLKITLSQWPSCVLRRTIQCWTRKLRASSWRKWTAWRTSKRRKFQKSNPSNWLTLFFRTISLKFSYKTQRWTSRAPHSSRSRRNCNSRSSKSRRSKKIRRLTSPNLTHKSLLPAMNLLKSVVISRAN